MKKTGFVEAWKVVDSKASKIGQAESFVEAKQQFCNGSKKWKMSYCGIRVDGNRGNRNPPAKRQREETQPQTQTATSTPITTAPAPEKRPTPPSSVDTVPTTATPLPTAEDRDSNGFLHMIHQIHSLVADNCNWKKMTDWFVTVQENGVFANRSLKKGQVALQVRQKLPFNH